MSALALDPQLVPLVFLFCVVLVLFTFVSLGLVFQTIGRSRSQRRRRHRHHRHRRHGHTGAASAAFVATAAPHDEQGLGNELD